MKNIAYVHAFMHSPQNIHQPCSFQHSHIVCLCLIYYWL